LFDFSPDAVVIRITQDPAPRLLYCFSTPDDGKTLTADALVKRIEAGDISKDEIVFGTGDRDSALAAQLKSIGIEPMGVKAACATAVARINSKLGIEG
jgi:CRISPR-associated protein Cst2